MVIVYGAPLLELQRRFQGLLREDDDDPIVGAASALVVPRNPERVFLIILNLSANDVFVRPNRPAASTAGIRLDPNGGGFTVNVDQDATLPTVEWHAIATAAGSQLYFMEVFRDTEIKGSGG